MIAATAQVDTRGPVRRHEVLSWVGLVLLAFAGPIVLSVAQHGFVYDDPFILARYAQHLADGVGWQFNPGMRTDNAVSSPLYVLLVAAPAAVGCSAVVASAIVYAIAWGLGGVVLARVLMRDGHQAGAWIACGLYSFSPLLANVRGMETTVFLLIILGAVWAVQRGRWIAVGVLLGLLTMVRSDGVALAVLLLAWVAWRRRRHHLVAVLVPFVAIAAAWAVALWALTGYLFPSTLAAKLAQRDSGVLGGQWMFLWSLNINGVSGVGQGSPMRVQLLGLIGLLLIVLAVVGTVSAVRRREFALPALAVVAAATVFEFGIALRMPLYIWHFAPWTLWVLAGAGSGVDVLVRRGRRFSAPAVAVVAGIAAVALAFTPGPDEARSHYAEVAAWIDRDSQTVHPTVAVNEIGKIGYYGRADIIDYGGLLDHRAIEPLRRGDFTWWLTQRPDYWVTATEFAAFDGQATASPQFQRNYHPAAQFGTVTVYRRN